MARSSLLTAGFLLAWATVLPAHAAGAEDQTMAPTAVATGAPIPLQEPHAVDQAPLPPLAVPTKRAEPRPHRPTAAKSRAKTAPARPQAAAKPAVARQTARPKARPATPELAARPPAPSHPKVAVKPKAAPRKSAAVIPRHPHRLAQAPHRPMRQARRNFEHRVPEERPHSGPVYDTPPDAVSPPMLAKGCDEACRYRDWLNRYAAWYRDFGRYYSSAPNRPAMPQRPAPPSRAFSENRPAPPAYRPDRSERDRLDPWHGYNPHSPSDGY